MKRWGSQRQSERKLAKWLSGKRTFQIEGVARGKVQRQERVRGRRGQWSEWGRGAMGLLTEGPGGSL